MYTKHGRNDLDFSSHNVKSSPFNMVDSSVDGRENRKKNNSHGPHGQVWLYITKDFAKYKATKDFKKILIFTIYIYNNGSYEGQDQHVKSSPFNMVDSSVDGRENRKKNNSHAH
jgi:hypothetical protein